MSLYRDRWVARFRESDHRLVSKFHLVDSDVSTRVVTRCGREMALDGPRGGLMASDEALKAQGVVMIDLCTRCQPVEGQ